MKNTILVSALLAIFTADTARATINLTTNITVPNVTRIRVEDFRINDSHCDVTLSLRPAPSGDDEAAQRAKAYARFTLTIRNAPATSTALDLAVMQSPPYPVNPYTGLVTVTTKAVPLGFDDLVTAVANATPKTAAAQKRAVEQILVTNGIVFAGTVN